MESNQEPRIHAILLAGGKGERFQGKAPKQFYKIRGETLLHRSLRIFHNWGKLHHRILVIRPEDATLVEEECKEFSSPHFHICTGGATRHESQLKGLETLAKCNPSSEDLVLIHDVARPFFHLLDLENLVEVCKKVGAATLATPVADTLVRCRGDFQIVESLPRTHAYQVKTPQIAKWKTLLQLQNLGTQRNLDPPTDLSTWCLQHGIPCSVVDCKTINLKITYPEDIQIAEALLENLPGLEVADLDLQ